MTTGPGQFRQPPGVGSVRAEARRDTDGMLTNRSMPDDVLIPVLAYPDVLEAIEWLEKAFGFRRRWVDGEDRAQVAVGDSAAISLIAGPPPSDSTDLVMVRIEDLDGHRARAEAAGARVGLPSLFPHGERQYTARDLAGRVWIFSESVADVAPAEWGAAV